MSSRDAIFAKIRAGLGDTVADPARKSVVAARIAGKHRHPVPARVAGKSHAEHVQTFRSYLEGQSATVLEVAHSGEAAKAIAQYLRTTNLPARLRCGDDPFLATLGWAGEPAVELRKGRAQGTDEVGLSHASAGVAETGTLVMASGADNPVTVNFLPETHIVVIAAGDIVGSYEDAWDRIRARFGERTMPRTVNMISGPSRTGDIGGKLVMGAHGPRRLCVVIVKS
jgi:L-lactate dehydrogenase complex protein LldG